MRAEERGKSREKEEKGGCKEERVGGSAGGWFRGYHEGRGRGKCREMEEVPAGRRRVGERQKHMN